MQPAMTFGAYKDEGANWITLATGEYYPDILQDATQLYSPVLVLFGQLVKTSESSERLFEQITTIKQTWMRIQLLRVYRRYVAPNLNVVMSKNKSKANVIATLFGTTLRPIQQVQAAFDSRPVPDEAICALLWEGRNRGQRGYDLTEKFFNLFRTTFPQLPIAGPERAGRDVLLSAVLADYPNPNRPVDFVIFDTDRVTVLAVGLARYDSDRGGSQEDDRTGGYFNVAREVLDYNRDANRNIKVIYLNDGPGLLVGSMWNDYARLEQMGNGRIMVLTLRMVPVRMTLDWLRS